MNFNCAIVAVAAITLGGCCGSVDADETNPHSSQVPTVETLHFHMTAVHVPSYDSRPYPAATLPVSIDVDVTGDTASLMSINHPSYGCFQFQVPQISVGLFGKNKWADSHWLVVKVGCSATGNPDDISEMTGAIGYWEVEYSPSQKAADIGYLSWCCTPSGSAAGLDVVID